MTLEMDDGNLKIGTPKQYILIIIIVAAILFLALYNLTEFPTTWLDEGAFILIPKTLVRFGEYAGYSAKEGFRYYGPSVSVGPTVLLPIAAMFHLFGIGLLQARLVIVIYLLLTIYSFYCLADHLGGPRLAWATIAVLIPARGATILELGRQVHGEVPGLFFLVFGLTIWFTTWERSTWQRLMMVGLLLGLASITKHIYFLVLVPTLGLAWLTNLIYYRIAPQRVFIVPGLGVTLCFLLWQAYLLFLHGPGTVSENWSLMSESVSKAALVLSLDVMIRSVYQLIAFKVYLSLLVPVLLYSLTLSVYRQPKGQKWGVLFLLVAVNLGWFVVFSVGWLRYAFPGLALVSIFVAQFLYDLSNGFQLPKLSFRGLMREKLLFSARDVVVLAMLAWIVLMMMLHPLQAIVRILITPPLNTPYVMAAYLNEHVPHDALIETREQEMGILTDHNYHFIPHQVLVKAIDYYMYGGRSPGKDYDFVQSESPDYLLVDQWSRDVDLYPTKLIHARYELITRIGEYELYKALDQTAQANSGQ